MIHSKIDRIYPKTTAAVIKCFEIFLSSLRIFPDNRDRKTDNRSICQSVCAKVAFASFTLRVFVEIAGQVRMILLFDWLFNRPLEILVPEVRLFAQMTNITTVHNQVRNLKARRFS